MVAFDPQQKIGALRSYRSSLMPIRGQIAARPVQRKAMLRVLAG
jgi:hypothetical protein